jgi:chromosome partitioning protein
MQRIVVLNPKGGSGKTTIATNLASHFALRGKRTVLMDYDVQGSSAQWVRTRQEAEPHINLISVFERDALVERSADWRFPEDTEHVIIDTPAAIEAHGMPELTRSADKILVPVLPSAIDVRACSRCVQNLLLVAKVHRSENRLGIIANRVRRHTLSSQSLLQFLGTLGLPVVATLRDSQNYVRAAELGLGLEEMRPYQVEEDLEHWQPLFDWLELPTSRHRSRSSRLQEASQLRL